MHKDKAKELLGIGLPNAVVAAAVGVTEGLVSQWMTDEVFLKEVIDLRATNAAEAVSRDKTYNAIEDSLLEILKAKLETSMLWEKREVLQALRIINGAVRRGSPQEIGGRAQIQVVQLQLPENSAFAAKFVLNNQNQVIEIAGRSMATMTAKGVVGQLEQLNKGREANKLAEQKDTAAAAERIKDLAALTHLPVAEVL